MKTFKDSSLRENILEGIIFPIIAFPFYPWWIAVRRSGSFSSGLSMFVFVWVMGSMALFWILSSFVKSDLSLLPLLGWLFALGYAVTGRTETLPKANDL